ncbi:DUF4276 family protein [Fulvivirgaceae bacterium BMA10]|uniref:DUF4276 family protein n=1 Tax=Splendidivirga corallicola TaxID=3051826 RepID=A0ABT8KM93_9BACT|nr:DUF4276 family protein [Fulvivirgaceae bacterium BMA10]
MQLNILVEGQTEEMFVKEILAPYLQVRGIYATPIIVSTKIMRDGIKFRGGLTNGNFNQFIGDLKKLINSTPNGMVSTFLDYYGLPSVFPNYSDRVEFAEPLKRVKFLENSLKEYLSSPKNFLPYIQLHEFEAFLFAHPKGFEQNLERNEANLDGLKEIINSHQNPEDINEGTDTSPSKRILSHYPGYDKVLEGNMMLNDIGLETLLEKCPHFNEWITNVIHFKSQSDT